MSLLSRRHTWRFFRCCWSRKIWYPRLTKIAIASPGTPGDFYQSPRSAYEVASVSPVLSLLINTSFTGSLLYNDRERQIFDMFILHQITSFPWSGSTVETFDNKVGEIKNPIKPHRGYLLDIMLHLSQHVVPFLLWKYLLYKGLQYRVLSREGSLSI